MKKFYKLLGFGISYAFEMEHYPINNNNGYWTYPTKYLGYGYVEWLGLKLFKIKTKLYYGQMDR
jgi:hypothetical protein